MGPARDRLGCRRSIPALRPGLVAGARRRAVHGLVEALVRAEIGATFNFYREGALAPLRRKRLIAYLEARADAPLLLVGEAPGWRGARISGIPFTSERQLTGSGPGEATATIVHRALAELGLEEHTLLWNAVPTHPHERGRHSTNRPPARVEVNASRPFLEALGEGRTVVAVGRVARCALPEAPAIRHPSRGGASLFLQGLRDVVR